jgi:RNA polymerase sigma-70 factor (ECF subfamily)
MSARNRTLGFEREYARAFVARSPRNEMRASEAEANLVRRARTGDRTAFDALVRLHFERVYTLMFRMTKNHEDAEDLAQEAFVRAWGALAGYREEAAFSTWVQRIGVHLAIAHQKRRGRRGLESTIEEAEVAVEDRDTGGRGELILALSRALDELPPRLRAAIVLRSLEEREYDDMAKILGVRPATARTHVMQARKLIMRWLAPWFEGGRK